MAQIRGIKDMQLALKDIEKQLKTVKTINQFLETQNDSGMYTLSFGNYSTPLICKDTEKIQELVISSKQHLVAQIRATAEANRIELDEDDEALLS